MDIPEHIPCTRRDYLCFYFYVDKNYAYPNRIMNDPILHDMMFEAFLAGQRSIKRRNYINKKKAKTK